MSAPDWIKFDVSRETMERLEVYAELIEKWNPRINLVSKASLSNLWDRHIWDSAQIANINSKGTLWADFGSGGGMPAIILAILFKDNRPEMKFQLVESDQRKCAFLRTVIREIGLNAVVLTNRVEGLQSLGADVISARALTDLNGLLGFAEHHLAEKGTAIFPKGETWEKEIEQAREFWSFDCEEIRSETNPHAAILKIKDIARV